MRSTSYGLPCLSLRPVLVLGSVLASCSDTAFQAQFLHIFRRHASEALCFPYDTSPEGLEHSSWLQASRNGAFFIVGFPKVLTVSSNNRELLANRSRGTSESIMGNLGSRSFAPLMISPMSWKGHFSPSPFLSLTPLACCAALGRHNVRSSQAILGDSRRL